MARKSSYVVIAVLLVCFSTAVGLKIFRQNRTPGPTGEWVARDGSVVLRIEGDKRIISLVDYTEGKLVKITDNAYRVESFLPYSGCKYRVESDNLVLTISGKTEFGGWVNEIPFDRITDKPFAADSTLDMLRQEKIRKLGS